MKLIGELQEVFNWHQMETIPLREQELRRIGELINEAKKLI